MAQKKKKKKKEEEEEANSRDLTPTRTHKAKTQQNPPDDPDGGSPTICCRPEPYSRKAPKKVLCSLV